MYMVFFFFMFSQDFECFQIQFLKQLLLNLLELICKLKDICCFLFNLVYKVKGLNFGKKCCRINEVFIKLVGRIRGINLVYQKFLGKKKFLIVLELGK